GLAPINEDNIFTFISPYSNHGCQHENSCFAVIIHTLEIDNNHRYLIVHFYDGADHSLSFSKAEISGNLKTLTTFAKLCSNSSQSCGAYGTQGRIRPCIVSAPG